MNAKTIKIEDQATKKAVQNYQSTNGYATAAAAARALIHRALGMPNPVIKQGRPTKAA